MKVFSDNDKKFSMNTVSEGTGDMITMHFDKSTCEVEDPRGDADAVARLKSQLRAEIDVSDASFGLFWVQADRTGTKDRDNVVDVTYDPDGLGRVILGWAHRFPPTVSEDREETFEFTGGRIRVAEDEGSANDRISILCESSSGPVTVVR